MAETTDLLVEIGTEELPPKSLLDLEQAFDKQVREGLVTLGLGFVDIRSYATPRRLALWIRGLAREQPPQKIEKRGPSLAVAFGPDGAPTRAAQAFADGCGVPVTALSRVENPKGAWLFHQGHSPGRNSRDLLPAIINKALGALPIARPMRWGSGDILFVRPVHWVVMLLGNEVLTAPILGLTPGRVTRGHRFQAPEELVLNSPADYPTILVEKGKVIPEFARRRARVQALADQAARVVGGRAVYSDALLDEVAGLVEWPVALAGSFDPHYLRLPEEVLIATLQGHQRYFPLRNPAGTLMAGFITTANLESRDPEQIRLGNERVILPRLADAAFFWDNDRKTSLAQRVERLGAVVFQKGLGSVQDHSRRVAVLGTEIARILNQDEEAVGRAALLAKADLLSQMVGEFPELQGRMGFHYATHDGEPSAVASAIEEQYLPRHAGDRLPVTPAGRILAIADRADVLAGVFALGKRPSGAKDPFGLRRAGLGLFRILVEAEIDLSLESVFSRAVALQPVPVKDPAALTTEVVEFILERARSWYLDGLAPGLPVGRITADTFEAVRRIHPASPLDFQARLGGVAAFLGLADAESLIAANKRIANILRTAGSYDQVVKVELFVTPEETALQNTIELIGATHRQHLKGRDYRQALQGLAGLKGPVDTFFSAVMVMAEEPALRHNRLAQLGQVRALFMDVADLSCLTTITTWG